MEKKIIGGNNVCDVSVFIDESGIVRKGTLQSPDYFVIGMAFTNNEKHVKKIFTRKRLKQLTEEEINTLKNSKEIKGSSMSEIRKAPIYEALVEKCKDDLELGIIILDLKGASDRLKQTSSRAFNFLIARYLSKYYTIHSKFCNANQISLFVDERNVATGAKFTLEEYLNTEYNIEDPICSGEISVQYLDSKNRNLIQFADFLANTFYRAYKQNSSDAKDNIELLKPLLCNHNVFYFPLPHTK